jgi:hypothetical protein
LPLLLGQLELDGLNLRQWAAEAWRCCAASGIASSNAARIT